MSSPTKSLIRFLGGVGFFIVAFCLAFLFIGWPQKSDDIEYGVTFSRNYSRELGLDPQIVLSTALDEIGIRRFRIPAYHSDLEPQKEQWHWDELDQTISEIEKKQGKVILAIGEKLPRWPECWSPDWFKKLPRTAQKEETLHYIEQVVRRYRNNPTIIAWQVENEPHFYYGDCPRPEYLFIQKETAFVRGLDPTRPITTTDSGELSSWATLGAFVDSLGVSVYRSVRNPLFGNVNLHYWFLPPHFYARKAMLLKPLGVQEIYISEFQMEPWSNTSLLNTPIEDQLTSMNVARMRANFEYASRMGIKQIDFWGIEWWVWMRDTSKHSEFIDEAKHFWQQSKK